MLEFILYFLLADFISGVIHWLEDTYGKPGMFKGILDKHVIYPNIAHHQYPYKITSGTYYQTNSVSILIASTVAAILFIGHLGTWKLYLLIAVASQFNQIHKWAHSQSPPKLIAFLQSLGILQSVRHHAVHHQRPYATKYCTFSNFLNPILDTVRFWRLLENLGKHFGLKVRRNTTFRNGY